jgi:hypothetical protein
MCYWPFNGNTNDESSNGNNGNNTNSVLTSNRFGNSNSAFYFDGNSRIENNDKPLFILTNQSYGIQFHENQYILFLTQNKKDIKKLQDNGIQNVVGNFYFTNQQHKETPTVFLHQRFLQEMKNILLRLNMKNPSLYFLLFFAILLYFPDDSIFLESDINLFVTNLEERKLFNYLMRKKYVKIHKSS